jgi:uncharacterized SAM-binding protein YcdF (DUF218 family)
MLITKPKAVYLTKFYWRSYDSHRLRRLVVESCLLGMPFFLFTGFNQHRLYVLRSSHAHNKSAECLEACVWLGRGSFICLFSAIRFFESHLFYNEGVLFYKLICYLEVRSFSSFKVFFCETTRFSYFI